jgi:hypothetical protein
MRTGVSSHVVVLLGLSLMFPGIHGSSQLQADDVTSSYAAGREYFVLRSGTAKLILQSDKSGTLPACTYMLFDADKPCQTLRQDRAFNFIPGTGFSRSALEVILGGVPFTALAHTTEMRWRNHDGIPAVEAHWWAGGIDVSESFEALEGSNLFLRTIVLKGTDIAGPDTVRVRLSLPQGPFFAVRSALLGIVRNVALGIAVLDDVPALANNSEGYLESLPLSLNPGEAITIRSLLICRIPAGGFSYDAGCEYDRPIDPRFLRSNRDKSAPSGLNARYYNNPDLRGTPLSVQRDTSLSPYWDILPPANGVRADSFSVRWTGYILPPATGKYRLSLVADDRARLFVGGRLAIDCWENSWNVTKTAEVQLDSGKLCRVRVEFAELTGWAGMRLRWSLPSPDAEANTVQECVRDMCAAIERLNQSHLSDEINATRRYWEQTSKIQTTDALVQHLYQNSCYALPGMVGRTGKMDAGIFEYGAQWVRDGSNVALGLIHAGHFESARALLNLILTDLVSDEGTTVISGTFDAPDREEFDQMGELMHALKAYQNWTGDSSLIARRTAKIIAMIERPLHPVFRDSTGMVHNRREYWERTFSDAYELAYQTFMISGLRDAADLSDILGVPHKAQYWREQADVILHAMLDQSPVSLMDQGALTKRRNVDGTIADYVRGPRSVSRNDDPYSTETFHRLNPDASYALPIFLHVVEPRSAVSRRTLDKLEAIWNARWNVGGYERYHSSSQQDQPGPWTFATASIARAQHDAGLLDRSRRSLEWLSTIQGGNAGAWFEEIPLIRSQMPTAGIVPWTSAEVVVFTIRHWLGLRFEGNNLILQPNLYPEGSHCKADLRFRSSRIRMEIAHTNEASYAVMNGMKILSRGDGAIPVPPDMLAGALDITLFAKKER